MMERRLTLVTGATGLLGNNVVRMLLEQGRSVRVLARQTSDPRPLEGLDVEIARGDVRDREAVARACQDVGCVIHCAGHVQIGRANLAHHREINVQGTRHVAECAREVAARLIHVSTCDALGTGSLEKPADEWTPVPDPLPVPYVLTKKEAEQVVLEQVGLGLDAVIVNPSFMLGPWDWKPSSGRMLLAVSRGRALMAPRGTGSFCDARDVAAGILSAIERGQSGQRYILAGANLRYLEAFRLFAEVCGVRRPVCQAGPLMLILAGRAGDLCTRITGREPVVNSGAIAQAKLPKSYSSQRAKAELGYRIRPLRESVEDTWRWFQEHGYR